MAEPTVARDSGAGARVWHDAGWRTEFERGTRDTLPACPGIMAWGLVTGVAMAKSGLTVPQALVMSLVAYAGSAQLASLPLLASAAPAWVIGATALATNMRFVIYAAALRQWLSDYSLRRRSLLGFLSGDFSFVLFMNRVAREGFFAHRDGWLLGMTAVNWLAWQVASVGGILGARFIPTDWGLQFAGTLALLALIVPACRAWPGATGAVVAGIASLLARGWPYRLGLLAAALAGMAAASAAFTQGKRTAPAG
jgi:predicted branched-subunit amino acid permease